MAKLDNIILCILGKSGSGKTTIAEKLNKEYGYEILNSYTTRPPRYDGEIGHEFIDKETFQALPNKVALADFNNHWYCATQEQIDSSDIYVIDKYGLKQLKELYHGKKKIVSVYVDVPMEICLERMRKRGDKEDNCWSRLRHDDSAFQGVKGEVDYVVNGIPNSTWYDVENIIKRYTNHKTIVRSGVYEIYKNIC